MAAAAGERQPAPIASLSQFARVAATESEWLLGTSGPYAGWLALRGKDGAGAERLQGVPWSTCALWRLGRELQPAPAAGAQRQSASADLGGPAVCEDR